jgi:hypothetical protein
VKQDMTRVLRESSVPLRSTHYATGTLLMKKPNSAGGIGSVILFVLFGFLAARLVSRLGKPAGPLLEGWGIPPALVVVCGIVVVALVLGVGLKQLLMSALPSELRFVPARREDFPQMDWQTVDRYTYDLQGFGFVWALDYTLESDVPTMPPGFGRLFIHPVHQCYAEVNQAFPPNAKPTPVRSMIASSLEGGWQLSTTDRKADAVTYMLRRPRSLWSSHPDAGPRELLQLHLEWRKRISAELGASPETTVSPEAYFAHEKADALERKEAFKRKNIFIGLGEMILFGFRPRTYWLGDCAQAGAPGNRA